MRRVTLALLGTIAGTTLLVGLKAQGATPATSVAGAPLDPAAGTAAADPTASDEPTPATSAAPTSAVADPGPGTPQEPSQTQAQPPPPPPPPASRTILGDAVATVWQGENYGTTQVKIVVTGTHIDDIVAVKQGSRPKTTATTLRSQALAAQSADVGNVSGATASSMAYKQSLQSAIAKI